MAFISLTDLIYPVGTYYINANGNNMDTVAQVAAKFGGTWEKIADGKCLRSGSSNATGGADTVALTAANLPKNIANIPLRSGESYSGSSDPGNGLDLNATDVGVTGNAITNTKTSWSGLHAYPSVNWNAYGFYNMLKIAGSGTAHSNIPAYQTVQVFKRTA